MQTSTEVCANELGLVIHDPLNLHLSSHEIAARDYHTVIKLRELYCRRQSQPRL